MNDEIVRILKSISPGFLAGYFIFWSHYRAKGIIASFFEFDENDIPISFSRKVIFLCIVSSVSWNLTNYLKFKQTTFHLVQYTTSAEKYENFGDFWFKVEASDMNDDANVSDFPGIRKVIQDGKKLCVNFDTGQLSGVIGMIIVTLPNLSLEKRII